MYKVVDDSGKVYMQYTYEKEAEFEKMVVANSEKIFGSTGIYFNIKKLIGIPKKGATIPDGYFLDLTFHDAPRLYLVEVELNSHDVYGHIGEQILRFGISTQTDKYKIKNCILSEVEKDENKKKKLDTIVVPAREDGFKEEFLKNNQWFAVRISSAMIDKIKYIAVYQVSPISGITHIAEVRNIEKYNDTNKYILYFKTATVKQIHKISLGKKKALAPQAPRYSSYKKILESKTLDDLRK